MSANELGSLHDLGVSATLHNNCPPLLASLDLSNNELSMVELETLLSWPSITSLNLGSNYIRFVADSVLANSTALVTLDMSNNQMSQLPHALLAGLPLRELLLDNDSLDGVTGFANDNFLHIYDNCGDSTYNLPPRPRPVPTRAFLLKLQYQSFSLKSYSTMLVQTHASENCMLT